MSKGSAIAGIVFAFVCGVLVGHLASSGISTEKSVVEEEAAAEEAAVEEGAIERFRIPVGVAQPSKGPKDALVTMVLFSDFQCPFSARVEPTVDALMKEYAGKLRVVWRNNPLPFHKEAEPAAEAALEARAQGGDEKFWKMHKMIFENKRKLDRESLEKYASQIGLDLEKFRKALDEHTHKRSIDADRALAARMGARGTPAFFINGRLLSGAQPKAKFKEVIDDEIKRAEKLIKSGVAKSRVYATLTKEGLTKAKPKERDKKRARKQPDPNAVYKVPIGKSYSRVLGTLWLLSSSSATSSVHFLTASIPRLSRSWIPTVKTCESFTNTMRCHFTKTRHWPRKPPKKPARRASSGRCTTRYSKTSER